MRNRKPRTYAPDQIIQIQQFRNAAKSNLRKFIEKYLYIRTKRGTLELCRYNPVQDMYWASVEDDIKDGRPIRKIYVKHRQCGWSTLWSAFTFANAYGRDNIDALVVAHLRDRTTKLFQMHRLFLDCLPAELQLPLERSTRQELSWSDSLTTISLATAGTPSAGRGGTVQYVHASEAAYYPHLFDFLGALQQAVPEIPDSAVILETTANGTGNEFHGLWNAAVAGEVAFDPEFIKWMNDPECMRRFPNDLAKAEFMSLVDNDLKERSKHYDLTPEQMHWYSYTLRDKCQGDDVLMQQEYPCDPMEAFISSGTPVYPPKLTSRYSMMTKPGKLYDPTISFSSMGSLIESADLVRNRDPYLEIWEPPREGFRYLISADAAEGVPGGDLSSAFVFDLYTMRIKAELHGSIDPDNFARMLASLADMYNGAILAPETHGAGLSVILKLKEIYFNLYQWRKSDGYGFKITNSLGWETNTQSRGVMISESKAMYRTRVEDPDFIPSAALIDEIRTFVLSNLATKPIASSGCHDDRVMAWAIGVTVCLQELSGSDLGVTQSRDVGTIRPSSDQRLDPEEIIKTISNSNFTGFFPDDTKGEFIHKHRFTE